MDINIKTLTKDILDFIVNDIKNMESAGVVKVALLDSQRQQIKSEWTEVVRSIITHTTVKDQIFTAAFDGGATPNPGKMKIGGWIRNSDGERIYNYTEEIGEGTNNEAEYRSLIKLMEEIKNRGIQKVYIKGDSALVVNQVTGKWKTKDSRMKALKEKVWFNAEGIDYHLNHVLRKFNAEADSLT